MDLTCAIVKDEISVSGKVSFQSMLENEELRSTIQYQTGKEGIEIQLLIQRAFRDLTKRGFLYKVTDSNDLYEIVSIHNLGSFLIQMLKEGNKDGFGLELLLFKVKSHASFGSIPKIVIVNMLHQLIAQKLVLQKNALYFCNE
jgi:hypothetical protein